MAKQVYKIEAFHGGLNDNSDPRDIAENEFAVCKGVAVDELGIIRLSGKPNQTPKITQSSSDSEPGFGLITYKTDKDKDALNNPNEWLGVFDESDGGISVYYDGVNLATGNNTFDSQGTPKPGANFIDISNDDVNAKPSHYFSDGRVRVCDSDFTNTSGQSLNPQYGGYISENLYQTTKESTNSGTPIHKLGKWESGNQQLKTFDDLSVTLTMHQGDADTPLQPNETVVGDGSTKKIIMSYWRTKNGNWNGIFEFGFCPIYDGNQEAPISISTSTIPLVNEKLNIQFFIPMGTANSITSNSSHKLGDDRITGFNVYFRKYGAEEFHLLQNVDLRKGGEFHWKAYNSNTENNYGIWNSSGSDAFSLVFTTDGSNSSGNGSYDEVLVGASLTVNSNGFSGRKGFVRLYGFEPSPIYHALDTIATDSHVPIKVRNPSPGLKKFNIELLDEQFNLIFEGTEVERTIIDSGADSVLTDQEDFDVGS